MRARPSKPEVPRTGYVRGDRDAGAHDARRASACSKWLRDGLARSVRAIAEEANVTPAVVRGLIEAGALNARAAARIRAAATAPIRAMPM